MVPEDARRGIDSGDRIHLIEAIYRIVGQVEKRIDDLRAADRDATALAHRDLSKRLEGFPQQFATNVELEQAVLTIRRLDASSLSREVYEQQRQVGMDDLAKLERTKLEKSVYDTFIANYRIEQDRSAQERRDVAEILARATDAVRAQILEERGVFLTQESYDHQHQELVQQVTDVARGQYKIVGGLVFATVVAPAVTGLVVYALTTGF